MLFSHLIVVIASAVIALAWLTLNKRSQKIDDLPVLATCQSGTSAILSSKVNTPVVHGSSWYIMPDMAHGDLWLM